MKSKEKIIEDYVKDNISIFVDENIYSWRFYDSIELKYVYTNDKETNYINNFGVTMCLDNEEIGYFILKSMTLFNDVLNFKSYDRYVELLEFGLEVNDEKYAKSLLNYLLYIARIEGNKFVKISNRYKEFNYFYELLVKEYNAYLFNDSYYIEVTNPLLYEDLEHFRIYEDDSIDFESLQFLFHIGYTVDKNECIMTFHNGDKLIIDRKNLLVTYPCNITNHSNNEMFNKLNSNLYYLLYFINFNYNEILKHGLILDFEILGKTISRLNNTLIVQSNVKLDDKYNELLKYIYEKLNINYLTLYISGSKENNYAFSYEVVNVKKEVSYGR